MQSLTGGMTGWTSSHRFGGRHLPPKRSRNSPPEQSNGREPQRRMNKACRPGRHQGPPLSLSRADTTPPDCRYGKQEARPIPRCKALRHRKNGMATAAQRAPQRATDRQRMPREPLHAKRNFPKCGSPTPSEGYARQRRSMASPRASAFQAGGAARQAARETGRHPLQRRRHRRRGRQLRKSASVLRCGRTPAPTPTLCGTSRTLYDVVATHPDASASRCWRVAHTSYVKKKQNPDAACYQKMRASGHRLLVCLHQDPSKDPGSVSPLRDGPPPHRKVPINPATTHQPKSCCWSSRRPLGRTLLFAAAVSRPSVQTSARVCVQKQHIGGTPAGPAAKPGYRAAATRRLWPERFSDGL